MLLAVSLAASCTCGPNLVAAQPDVQVVPLAVDFGRRASGTLTTSSVVVTNTGSSPLVVSRTRLEGDARAAFSVGMAPERLEPGESFTLSVLYSAPLAEGPDGATLLLETNARSTPEVRVSLAGRSVLALDAGLVDAGVPDGGVPDAGAFDAGFLDEDDAGVPDDGGCVAPRASGTESVAYQINPAHSGEQPNDRLRLPLCRRWRRELGGSAGFPVVAGGRVFVATHTNQAGSGTLLWALDQRTGAIAWGPLNLGGSTWWAGLGYESGRVFAVTGSGSLRAVDAATGAVLWSRQFTQSLSDSAPTALNGVVYTSSSGGAVSAFAAADGGLRWAMPVTGGSTSSPAVSATGVYVAYACNNAYGFNPATGAQLWNHRGGCSGGGGKNVALHHGVVHTRDTSGDLLLDAANGQERGTYASRYVPAFTTDLLFTTTPLQAQSLLTGTGRWTFDTNGERLTLAPVVVGPHVIAATEARLLAINVSDGSLASSFPVTGVRSVDEQNLSDPLAGFAAANGMLFVPVGNALEAY